VLIPFCSEDSAELGQSPTVLLHALIEIGCRAAGDGYGKFRNQTHSHLKLMASAQHLNPRINWSYAGGVSLQLIFAPTIAWELALSDSISTMMRILLR
jgi:hypothetical protein